ncbi:hypothetical protein BHM03_00048523 [Ensete ventricosum]|nr:hypothetical protein BHM03_00048523 [Ensete ventricosum]
MTAWIHIGKGRATLTSAATAHPPTHPLHLLQRSHFNSLWYAYGLEEFIHLPLPLLAYKLSSPLQLLLPPPHVMRYVLRELLVGVVVAMLHAPMDTGGEREGSCNQPAPSPLRLSALSRSSDGGGETDRRTTEAKQRG